MEQEKTQKEKQNAQLDTDLEQVNENLARLAKEKRSLEEKLKEAYDSLQKEEDKANHLNKVKSCLLYTSDAADE